MKNKKFLVTCSNGVKIPIDQDELVEVYKAITENVVKFLRKGAFNPSFFVGIVEDEETMRRMYDDLKYKIRDGLISEWPRYEDMFKDLRAEVKTLSLSKTGNPQLP